MPRTFLLSPARSAGRRAQILCRPGATFELARQLEIGAASLGEVFTFCSGLYFRGKLAYGRRFAQPADSPEGVKIIVPGRGLVAPEIPTGAKDLEAFAGIPVDAEEPRFREPLEQAARDLVVSVTGEIVLLGSIATGKYVDVLLPILGDRLYFPTEFVGRGDMSRGGLMLRCAANGEELSYQRLAGSTRSGRRAPRIPLRDIP